MAENNTTEQKPEQNMNRIAVSQKTTELILVLVVLVTLILGLYFFFGRNKIIKPVVGPSPAVHKELPESSVRTFDLPNQPKTEATASLILETAKTTFTTGETFNLNVIANANGEVVDGVEFVLTYSPKMMTAGNPVLGKFFSLYPQKNVDNKTGQVKIVALQNPNDNKELTSEVVITIPITVISNGTATIAFASDKNHIAAYGGQELLKETLPLTITIE